MKHFSYIIKDKDWQIKKGIKEAKSRQDLREYFHSQGFKILSIDETHSGSKTIKTNIPFERPNIFTIAILSVVFGSGLFFLALYKAGYLSKPQEKPILSQPIRRSQKPSLRKNRNIIEYQKRYTNQRTSPETAAERASEVVPEKPPESYFKAKQYYRRGKYKEAIRQAQYALYAGGKYSDEMRDLINTCRKRLRQ